MEAAVANDREQIAVRRESAAAMLDISLDSFDRHVRPEVAPIRRGRLVLFAVDDLKAWVGDNARSYEER